MHRKGLKRSLAMLLVFVFVFSFAAVQASAEDATEPVRVNANGNVGDSSQTYDNVTIAEMEDISAEGQPLPHSPAVIVYAEDGKSAEVTVNEDISANANTGETTGTEGVALHAVEAESSASAEVGGDITVQAANDSMGVRAVAAPVTHEQPGADAEGGTAQVTVEGNVSTTVTGEGDSAHAVGVITASANGGEATASVGGDVAAVSGSEAIGVVSDINAGGTASTSVGGDVSAEAAGQATGVSAAANGADAEMAVSIGGDVSAESKSSTAVGENVWSMEGGTASITVEGDVAATGMGGGRNDFGATGAHIGAEGEGSGTEATLLGNLTATAVDGRAIGASVYSSDGGEAALTVVGDITAVAAGDGNGPTQVPALANGVNLMANGGTSTLTVGGDLTASGMSGTGLAVDVASDSEAKAAIAGDLSGQEQGLWVRALDKADNKDASVEVTVGGTLSAKSDEGTAVVVSEGVTPDNLKLTVWKIDLDQNDNAVVQKSYNAETGVMSSEVTETTRAIEQSIQYIIKVEPTQADLFKGTQETAKEGENVTVKLSIPDGLQLDGAFTDEGKQVELLKDADGNYYVIMPKGGGVYLSAKLSEIPAAPAAEPAAGPAAVPAAKDAEKAQETQAAEKAETEAVKTIAETTAADRDGNAVIVANGTLDEKTATAEMKTDFEALTGKLVDAGKALSADVLAAIPAEIKSAAAGDAALTAGQPFRSVASKYPATVTVQLGDADSFVGLMAFINGKWVKVDTVINDDGTVTYVLTEPSVLSVVSQQKTA